jgi:hypothetical protein
MQRFDVGRCDLTKLNETEGEKHYHIKISNRFTALENFDDDVDINRGCEAIRENIKISSKESLGYYELKQCKPWFDNGRSKVYQTRGKRSDCSGCRI